MYHNTLVHADHVTVLVAVVERIVHYIGWTEDIDGQNANGRCTIIAWRLLLLLLLLLDVIVAVFGGILIGCQCCRYCCGIRGSRSVHNVLIVAICIIVIGILSQMLASSRMSIQFLRLANRIAILQISRQIVEHSAGRRTDDGNLLTMCQMMCVRCVGSICCGRVSVVIVSHCVDIGHGIHGRIAG